MTDDYSILQNRLPGVLLPAGEIATIRTAGGRRIRLMARAATLTVTDGDRLKEYSSYDAVFVRTDVLRLEAVDDESPRTARTWLIDVTAGQAVCVTSVLRADSPLIEQRFEAGIVETGIVGADGEWPTATAHPTRELIGRRAVCRYSAELVFEQIYLNSVSLGWQDLADGTGRSGADPATYWKLADGLYVIGFREPAFHTGSLFVLDLQSAHSTGTYLSFEDGVSLHGRLGSLIHELDATTYPSDLVPV